MNNSGGRFLGELDKVSDVIYRPILEKGLKKLCASKAGDSQILEIGSGIGSITTTLLKYGHVSATDINPDYVDHLNSRFSNKANFKSYLWDASKEDAQRAGSFDLLVSFNVLEHLADDDKALENWGKLIKDNGSMIILTPNYKWLFSSLDKAVSHFRRYSKKNLTTKVKNAGFEIIDVYYGNAFGILGWILNGLILKRTDLPSGQLKMYAFCKKLLWIFEKIVEKFCGLSVIVVAKKI